ncbi:G5 domain-containing protein [Streptococcus merionis]|uniref:G5 domain-containing protein n=1 Tax=Streptococcus merionis TaxID=400065 RepID=UPI0035140F1B
MSNILVQAQAEASINKINFEAAEKVRQEINGLEYLTKDQKIGYSTELEDKTKTQAEQILERAKKDNLQGLVKTGQELIKELQSELAKVEKLPEAPKTDDYNEQHGLWKELLNLGKGQIDNFKIYSVKSELKDFNKIEKFYKDLVDFKSHILIESYTRQVAKYREKYPKNQKIVELFNKHLKQASNNHYGTQTGKDLQHYINSSATPAFQEIQQLVKNLDKQAEGIQKLEKLIAEYSQKPKTSELIKDLQNHKDLLSILNTESGDLKQVVEGHIKRAEEALATYNKEYQMYQQVLQKGQEDIRAQIARLRALKNEKAIKLADKIEKQEISYLATAELSGAVGYKTFIPNNVARIKQEVDEFIAEYEKNHRPLTPLEPAIVESKEVEKQEIAYETQKVSNPNLEKGKSQVKIKGQKGEKTITYKVKKQGDKVISREQISEQVTKAPVTEVVEVGTKEESLTPPKSEPQTHRERKELKIPFETKQVENKDLPKGQTHVKQEGKAGVRTIVEEITTKDGKVVSRKTIIDEVATQPIARIIEVGTKEAKLAPVPSTPETKPQQEKNEMGTKEPEKMAPEMAQKSQKQVSAGTQKGSSDKTPKKQLPNTGEATSIFAALGSVLLILVMALAIQKKKKSEK